MGFPFRGLSDRDPGVEGLRLNLFARCAASHDPAVAIARQKRDMRVATEVWYQRTGRASVGNQVVSVRAFLADGSSQNALNAGRPLDPYARTLAEPESKSFLSLSL